MLAGIVAWVVIGFVVGLAVSRLLNLHGDDPRLGIAAAVVGAVVAAIGYHVVSGAPVYVWNVWALLWAAAGAAVSLVAWHGVRSRFVSRAPQTSRRSY